MPDDPRNPHDRPEHRLPQPDENRPGHQLPWPEESDPARLGEGLDQPAPREGRDLGRSFERTNEGDERELGRTFGDVNYRDKREIANSFADPNSLDDKRIGKSFEEANFSGKKHKPPLSERVPRPKNRKPLLYIVVGFVVLFALVLLAGWFIRRDDHQASEKAAKQQKNEKPMVEATVIHRAKDQAGLTVPGTTIPLTEAYVYARANGYLKKRLVDIGDHVREGQLLAIIDAPDLDAQVEQAREQLHQAQAQLELQKSQLALDTVTVQRYRVLVTKGVFSRQQGDQEEATYASQVANVAAAQRNVQAFKANLDRAIALQSYEYVRAPFSGVVTQRNVDVGALISASGTSSGAMNSPAPMGQISSSGGTAQASQTNSGGSSGSPSTAATTAQSPGQGGPLFGIAQIQRLRVLVSVPEGYVTSIHPGGHAQLAFQTYSGEPFMGDITRTANSVDPNTRTMLTEVQIDNKQGKLVPGMYVVATFPAPPATEAPLLVSGDAVAIRQDTTVVGVVRDGVVHLQPVVLGRDFGTAIEILNGLKDGDTVITNVTDDVVEKAQVQIHKAESPEATPTAPPAQNTPPGGSSQYGEPGITDRNLQGQQAQQDKKGSGQQQQQKSKPSNSESKQ